MDIVNVSGWGNNFVPWVLGLSQAALSTTAMDVPTHFSEEMANPARQVPIAIFGGLGTSIVVTLAYAFVLVFTLPELDAIITTSTGFPFAEMLRLKTSRSGAIVLLLIPLVSFLITSADVAMAASRCIYGFSRQRGFPSQRSLARSTRGSTRRCAPVCWFLVCQSCIGLIYLGNTAAFNAIISVPTLLLAVSYAIVAGVCLAARYRAAEPSQVEARSTSKLAAWDPTRPRATVLGIRRSGCPVVDHFGQSAHDCIYGAALRLPIAAADVAGDERQHELHFSLPGGQLCHPGRVLDPVSPCLRGASCTLGHLAIATHTLSSEV